MLVLVDVGDTGAWFDEYLRAFAACGRGESDDLGVLLHYYGVPLLLTTDAAAVALVTEDEVLNAVGQQITGMRAAGYDRSETLDSDMIVLNATSALQTAGFSRQRADGSEIGRLRATSAPSSTTSGPPISSWMARTAVGSPPWPFTPPDLIRASLELRGPPLLPCG